MTAFEAILAFKKAYTIQNVGDHFILQSSDDRLMVILKSTQNVL